MKHFYVLFMQSVSPFAVLQIEFALVNCCKGKKEKRNQKQNQVSLKKKKSGIQRSLLSENENCTGEKLKLSLTDIFNLLLPEAAQLKGPQPMQELPEVLKANVEPSVYF